MTGAFYSTFHNFYISNIEFGKPNDYGTKAKKIDSSALCGWRLPMTWPAGVLTGGPGEEKQLPEAPVKEPWKRTWATLQLELKGSSAPLSSGNPRSKGLSSTTRLSLLRALNIRNPLCWKWRWRGARREGQSTNNLERQMSCGGSLRATAVTTTLLTCKMWGAFKTANPLQILILKTQPPKRFWGDQTWTTTFN